MNTSKRLWQVNLSLTTDSDKDLHVLIERIRQETYPKAEGWQRLGLFLLKMGQSDKAEQIYTVLLKRTYRNRKKAPLYHQLRYVKQNQGNYSEAIVCYESSLEFMLKSLRPNHPHLAASYNDIGNVYQNMREHSKAISFYKKTLEIQQKTLSSNHPDFATANNNISSAYYTRNHYSITFPFL
jgi:tetratricopeptide (TPR) repeat protein